MDEIIQEPPTTLSAEQRALLEGIPKYDMIGDYLRKVHTEMDLFVSMLELIGVWRESLCFWDSNFLLSNVRQNRGVLGLSTNPVDTINGKIQGH